MSLLKPARPLLSRRSIIAAATGLAASAVRGNCAHAQSSSDDLPDAAPAVTQGMPTTAPALSFSSATGAKLSLANYQGHGLVVNIWATWCGPCVAELPSFNAIAPALARHKILVLPISVDSNGLEAVKPFYASHNITNLPILLDPDGTSADALQSSGIPITALIDPTGRIVGQLEGGANWNTPDAIALIIRLTAPPPGAQPTNTQPSSTPPAPHPLAIQPL